MLSPWSSVVTRPIHVFEYPARMPITSYCFRTRYPWPCSRRYWPEWSSTRRQRSVQRQRETTGGGRGFPRWASLGRHNGAGSPCDRGSSNRGRCAVPCRFFSSSGRKRLSGAATPSRSSIGRASMRKGAVIPHHILWNIKWLTNFLGARHATRQGWGGREITARTRARLKKRRCHNWRFCIAIGGIYSANHR